MIRAHRVSVYFLSAAQPQQHVPPPPVSLERFFLQVPLRTLTHCGLPAATELESFGPSHDCLNTLRGEMPSQPWEFPIGACGVIRQCPQNKLLSTTGAPRTVSVLARARPQEHVCLYMESICVCVCLCVCDIYVNVYMYEYVYVPDISVYVYVGAGGY